MKSKTLLSGSVTAAVLLAVWAIAEGIPPSSTAPADRLEQGRYLVERVALCADCHTERDWRGKQDRTRWLRGSKLPFKPSRVMPWSAVAPAIDGLPSLADSEQAAHYFETGIKPDGKQSSPPMPQYRLSHSDALAVVAYLRSLRASIVGPAK
ncbi:MAG TPA: c-type cytochrome [Candidatus Paceibacterota bacterium]|nr:c-type cytochrome [Verrucomicrobiota bacterium]HSA11117.1 c-type cytochrome [Candidatus Paceibacterota bacterium]